MEEKRGIPADWSQLPLDLIEKIAGTLDEDIADRVRFGAVCKYWQSAVKPTANLPRVRLPWLCLMDDERLHQTNFFSLGRNKHYDILNTHRQIQATSSHGWILTVDYEKTPWLLLNPITKVQILLPPPPASDMDWIYGSELIVTPDSLAVVMVGFSHGPILCHRRPLNPNGVEIAGDAWMEICGRVDDAEQLTGVSNSFTYHQDRCFILDCKHNVTSIVDPDTRQVVSVIPPVTGTDIVYPSSDGFDLRYRYLARSSSGEELFLVISPSRTAKEIFEVFVLDRSDQQQAKWSHVRNIGQDVLFVDDNGALAMPAPRDSEICRRNCIVFSGFCAPQGFVESTRGLFDIDTDSVEELPALTCKNQINQRWFVPSLS